MKKYFELIDCLLLSYLGGFLDGYSLLFRGNKFTCMQTGNIIYFAIDLVNKNYDSLLYPFYLFICFVVGLIFAYLFEFFLVKYKKEKLVHPLFLIVILLLLLPNFFYGKTNGIDDSLICPLLMSICGGILLESFTKFKVRFTPTMMTNNTKLMVNSFLDSFLYKNKNYLYKGITYIFVIVFFVFGVASSALLINFTALAQYTIFLAFIVIILLLVNELIINKISINEINSNDSI